MDNLCLHPDNENLYLSWDTNGVPVPPGIEFDCMGIDMVATKAGPSNDNVLVYIKNPTVVWRYL